MKKTLIVVALILSASFAGYSLSQPKPCGAVCGGQIATVDARDFSQRMKESGVVILDVRTPEEFSQGHIQNAINIDFNNQTEFDTSLNSLDKTKTYLIYCRSGNRSGQAMKLMEAKGFTNIINLDGGIQSWQAAGKSLTK